MLQEGRNLQATLLSNRAEAFLRVKPPRFSEAAASAQAALKIDPTNEKARRRLERADPTKTPSPSLSPQQQKRQQRGGGGSGGLMPAGGWRGLLLEAVKKGGGQTLAMFILLAVMAIIQAVRMPYAYRRES